MHRLLILFTILIFICSGCGVYSFTGASVEGKTLNMHILENRARNVVPALSPTLTNKIRSRILTQTGLSPVNTDNADYDISGTITTYEVTVSGVTNIQVASQNKLTISINIIYKNKLNEKNNFNQAFSWSEDFPASTSLQSAESALIEKIGNKLADDIFNKAFVNW
jgi:hypothetical protein